MALAAVKYFGNNLEQMNCTQQFLELLYHNDHNSYAFLNMKTANKMMCSFLVSIHSFGLERRSTGENARPRRASAFRMPKNFSAYKGTARCCLATTKIRAGESLREVLKILRYGFHSRVCSRCNITTVSGQKKAIGADWSGHRNRSVLPCCILRQD